MRKVPRTKTTTTLSAGCPPEASQTAHSVGQSRSSAPMGLSRRTSRSYASSRFAISARSMAKNTLGVEKIALRAVPALDMRAGIGFGHGIDGFMRLPDHLLVEDIGICLLYTSDAAD